MRQISEPEPLDDFGTQDEFTSREESRDAVDAGWARDESTRGKAACVRGRATTIRGAGASGHKRACAQREITRAGVRRECRDLPGQLTECSADGGNGRQCRADIEVEGCSRDLLNLALEALQAAAETFDRVHGSGHLKRARQAGSR